jgi:SM-20-related protein
MDSLREAINRGLFLGLEDFESHFAMYPPGRSTSSISTVSRR